MLKLDIVTPLGLVVDCLAEEVTVPGVRGELGVLEGHIPFIGVVQPGVVSYRRGGTAHRLAIGDGFAEVGVGDHVLVLTEVTATAEDIDLASVREELREIEEEKLSEWAEAIVGEDGTIAPERRSLEAAARWARARIEVLKGN